jgi:hypothetical protein
MRGTCHAPDGRRVPISLEGCDVCVVTDGRIAALRGYVDRARLAAQHGAGPAA